jgi:hypothetical protein
MGQAPRQILTKLTLYAKATQPVPNSRFQKTKCIPRVDSACFDYSVDFGCILFFSTPTVLGTPTVLDTLTVLGTMTVLGIMTVLDIVAVLR